jgi:hypothetical protein
LDAEFVGVGAGGEGLEGFDVVVEAEHVGGSRADVVALLPGCGELGELLCEVDGVVVEVPGPVSMVCSLAQRQ